MKVRLDFDGAAPDRPHMIVEMDWVPRIGESLALKDQGTCEVTSIVHTPQEAEQKVVVKLSRKKNGEKPVRHL